MAMIIAQMYSVISKEQISEYPLSPAHLQLNYFLLCRSFSQTLKNFTIFFFNNLDKKKKGEATLFRPHSALFDHITLSLFCPRCPADQANFCLKVYWPVNRD